MSETTADEIDMVMAIAADPEVWDATDDTWLMTTRQERRSRARIVAASIRASLEAKGFQIVKIARRDRAPLAFDEETATPQGEH